MHIIDGMLGVVIALVWGVILFNLDLSHSNLSTLALTIFITTLSTCALGLLLGCMSLITVNVMFINNFVYFALLIFSGANVPIEKIPRHHAVCLVGLAADARHRRGAPAGGWRGNERSSSLLWSELGIGLLYGLLGYFLFAWFEVQAKRHGTLEVF